jgi:metal-dependent amidase/aminoacylase/carboxypeptidase family protein
VRFETMIRGKTVESIDDASMKVDRALRAGAVALGAQVEIQTLPGYLPVLNHRPVVDVFRENFLHFHPESAWGELGHGTWSGDLGDVSHIMPAIVPSVSGFAGTIHGSDWHVTDPYLAYILPAKLMAMTVIDLLAGGAGGARAILDAYTPAMTKDEYLTFMRRNNRREDFDGAAIGNG